MKKKLLIATSILALFGGGIYLSAGYAIKPIATALIRQNGFPEATISSISLIPSGLIVENISLDGHDFSTIDDIVISLDWIKFLETKQVQSLKVKDISLTGELDSLGHLKIAGWDATLPKSNESSGLFPIQSLLLQGVTIDLDTPYGDIRFQGKLSLQTTGATQQTIEYALWGQQHQLSFDAKGSGSFSSNGDINFLTTLNEARLNLPNIELSRASGEFNFRKSAEQQTPHITGKFLAGKINTLGALLQNVDVSLDTDKAESVSFKTSPAGYKDIQIEGKWITAPDNYIELSINSEKTLDVIKLLYPDKVKDYKSWFSNSNPLALNIKAPIDSLGSEKMSANFNLSLGKQKSNMNLNADGTAIFESNNSKTSLQIDKLDLQIAGGQVIVSPFAFNVNDFGKNPLPLTLSVKSIDMSKMAKLADIKGLRVDGHLSGTLPMTYSDKGIIFGEGLLTSDTKGQFNYNPTDFPSALQGDDERMQIVRETLSNFEFSKLSFDMSGELDKKMKTTLTAEGKNPEFSDRPIRLNLNLDGDLGGIIKQALQTADMSDKIKPK